MPLSPFTAGAGTLTSNKAGVKSLYLPGDAAPLRVSPVPARRPVRALVRACVGARVRWS